MYRSYDLLKRLIQAFPMPIREMQTDNGAEFTMALRIKKPEKNPMLFERARSEYGIRYHRIRVATPRHNGKAERQHREDQKRFYSKLRIYNLSDGQKQRMAYNRKSNTIPKICLGLRTSKEVMMDYPAVM